MKRRKSRYTRGNDLTGKTLTIDFDGNSDYEAVSGEYDRRVFSYGQAHGCERGTFQQEISVDFTKYKDVDVK